MFSLSLWSALILGQIASFITAIRKAYFLLISFSIALFESYISLFMNESEKMVFIEIFPRKTFCQVLPVVAIAAVSLSAIRCLANDRESPKIRFNRMIVTMVMILSMFVTTYFVYPDDRYTNYTVFCPFLPICY